MEYNATSNSVTSSIIHHYQPQNKHYYFSPHTLHCNTCLQAPYRHTSQLSATCTCQLIILWHTPPNWLLAFSKSYVALNDIRLVPPPAVQRLPITIDIMHQIKSVLQQQPNSYHNILMWATCCLAFFGFLRCNEFTLPSHKEAMIQLHTFHIAILQWMTVIIPLWLWFTSKNPRRILSTEGPALHWVQPSMKFAQWKL